MPTSSLQLTMLQQQHWFSNAEPAKLTVTDGGVVCGAGYAHERRGRE